MESKYEVVDIEKIQPGFNPRMIFDNQDGLKESIADKGVLTPIFVRRKNEHYEIVCGERRYRFAKELGLSEIPIFIKELDNESAEDIAFIDNKKRNNFNPIEEAEFFKFKKDKYGLTLRELSGKGFDDYSYIDRKLKLLTLPDEIKILLSRDNKLNIRNAYEITRLCKKDELTHLFKSHKLYIPEWENVLEAEIAYRQKMQINLANQVIESDLTVKTVQSKVKDLLEDLKQRDQNILDGIEEEKKKQALFEGIYFKSAEDMSELEDGSIHLIVTSPPYFAGKEYEKDLSFDDYKNLITTVIKECDRVLCPGGVFCLNIGDIPNLNDRKYFIARLIEDSLTDNLFIKDSIVWKKDDPWQSNPHIVFQNREGKYRILPSTEHIFLIYKNGKREVSATSKLESGITKDEWTEWVSGLWTIPSVRNNKEHPAQFPEELPRRLIKMYSFKGDNVLDPFLGSGTTVKVARDLERYGFGYEKEEKYKKVIEKKLKNNQSEGR